MWLCLIQQHCCSLNISKLPHRNKYRLQIETGTDVWIHKSSAGPEMAHSLPVSALPCTSQKYTSCLYADDNERVSPWRRKLLRQRGMNPPSRISFQGPATWNALFQQRPGTLSAPWAILTAWWSLQTPSRNNDFKCMKQNTWMTKGTNYTAL